MATFRISKRHTIFKPKKRSTKIIPSESHPYPLRETLSNDVISAEAVALCIGISVSTQKLASTGDLQLLPKGKNR